MLKINAEGKWDLLPFSPGYYARNPIPIPWASEATCPQFDALLAFALPRRRMLAFSGAGSVPCSLPAMLPSGSY